MEDLDYSFKILEEILMLKTYNNREEVIKIGQIMLDIANKKDISDELKKGYKEAFIKLNKLTFDEMNEIIEILSEEDDEDDDEDLD